jgi:hypothetical protein
MQNLEDIKFPVFRKYKNNRHYYQIMNNKEFEEIQVIGSRKTINRLLASQLPEFNLIHDLIHNYSAFAEVISEDEYQRVKADIL